MAAHVTVLDSSSVTLHSETAAATVSGPLTVQCESVTVGGSSFLGTVIVKDGTAFQASSLTPGQSDLFTPALTLAFILAFVAVKLRL